MTLCHVSVMTKAIFSSFDDFSLDSVGSEAELIPLMTSEDEEALEKEELPEVVPLLPVKNTVLFPGVVIPITVGRDKSIQLIKDANKSKNPIGVVAQKDKKIEENWNILNIDQNKNVLSVNSKKHKILCLMWHPEREMSDYDLFKSFLS